MNEPNATQTWEERTIEEAAKSDNVWTKEHAGYVLWNHTGFPYPDGVTGEEHIMGQVRRYIAIMAAFRQFHEAADQGLVDEARGYANGIMRAAGVPPIREVTIPPLSEE